MLLKQWKQQQQQTNHILIVKAMKKTQGITITTKTFKGMYALTISYKKAQKTPNVKCFGGGARVSFQSSYFSNFP